MIPQNILEESMYIQIHKENQKLWRELNLFQVVFLINKDYYTQAKMMTCQVPMMIITNTKSIFIKRAKRLKKI